MAQADTRWEETQPGIAETIYVQCHVGCCSRSRQTSGLNSGESSYIDRHVILQSAPVRAAPKVECGLEIEVGANRDSIRHARGIESVEHGSDIIQLELGMSIQVPVQSDRHIG